MKAQLFLCRMAMIILFAGSAVVSLGANIAWTGAGDGNWNTAANWYGGVVPGGGDTAYFSDTYALPPYNNANGTSCTVNGNITVGSISFASSNVANNATFTLTINAPNSLTVTNGALSTSQGGLHVDDTITATNLSYKIASMAVNVVGNGTLLFGAAGKPSAALIIGVAKNWTSVTGGTKPPLPASFTMTNGVFNFANVGTITVGCDANNTYLPVSTLDVSGTTNVTGTVTNMVNVGLIQVGCQLANLSSLTPNSGTLGTLKLSPAVTNLTVANLGMGGGAYGTNLCAIDLGTSPQLQSFTIASNFAMANGLFIYTNGSGVVYTGMPNNVQFQMGTAANPAGFLGIGVGAASISGSSYNYSTNIFGPGIGSFSAYLGEIHVGVAGTNGPAINVTELGLLDLRGATNLNVTLSSMVSDPGWNLMPVLPAAVIIGTTCSSGTVYLASGTVTCSNLYVGGIVPYAPFTSPTAGTTVYSGSGLLSLSNTHFVVNGGVTIGATNQARFYSGTAVKCSAIVTNTIMGTSSGLDIIGASPSLVITNLGAGGSVLALNFLKPPQTMIYDYWGLRMAGDQRTLLSNLNAAGRLTWTNSGFSGFQQANLGIHYNYNNGNDYTFVGVPAVPSGLSIFLK